jgi:hypothetical protein
MELFDSYILAGMKGLSTCLFPPLLPPPPLTPALTLTHGASMCRLGRQVEELIAFQGIQYITFLRAEVAYLVRSV